ncbi:MAG: hypothetical protein K2K40_03150 [Paramuribaculum sp.]|nr:hypothetical protein [Paramuribaculum sp.]
MDNSTKKTLAYNDEADRAYGAAGMTVAIVVCNAEDLLVGVNLDADEPSEMMELSDDYYYAGSNAKSVRASWQQTLSAYRAGLVMAAGNVIARSMAGNNKPVSAGMRLDLREAIEPDGLDTCQLEVDEIDELFDQIFSYLQRVFSNAGVIRITNDFAGLLRRERRLGRSDILYALRPLARL